MSPPHDWEIVSVVNGYGADPCSNYTCKTVHSVLRPRLSLGPGIYWYLS